MRGRRCGKSTLLKALAGQWPVVSGECTVHVASAYIDQHLALLDGNRSIVEQLNLLDTPLAWPRASVPRLAAAPTP